MNWIASLPHKFSCCCADQLDLRFIIGMCILTQRYFIIFDLEILAPSFWIVIYCGRLHQVVCVYMQFAEGPKSRFILADLSRHLLHKDAVQQRPKFQIFPSLLLYTTYRKVLVCQVISTRSLWIWNCWKGVLRWPDIYFAPCIRGEFNWMLCSPTSAQSP